MIYWSFLIYENRYLQTCFVQLTSRGKAFSISFAFLLVLERTRETSGLIDKFWIGILNFVARQNCRHCIDSTRKNMTFLNLSPTRFMIYDRALLSILWECLMSLFQWENEMQCEGVTGNCSVQTTCPGRCPIRLLSWGMIKINYAHTKTISLATNPYPV